MKSISWEMKKIIGGKNHVTDINVGNIDQIIVNQV